MARLKPKLTEFINISLMSIVALIGGSGANDKSLTLAIGSLRKYVKSEVPYLQAETEEMLSALNALILSTEKILDLIEKQSKERKK